MIPDTETIIHLKAIVAPLEKIFESNPSPTTLAQRHRNQFMVLIQMGIAPEDVLVDNDYVNGEPIGSKPARALALRIWATRMKVDLDDLTAYMLLVVEERRDPRWGVTVT